MDSGRRNSCSQIRITEYPSFFSSRLTFRARLLFAATLFFQYRRFTRGSGRLQVVHPCQKQPSTKIATVLQRRNRDKPATTGRARPSHEYLF